MSHLNTDDLAALDAAALDHAYALQASLSGLRMEDPPAPADPAPADPAPSDPAPADPPADPAPAPADPDLSQQALDAIEALKKTGAEIPEALTAAVTELKNARGEAANYRTKLRDVETKQTAHDEVLQGIAKALGLDQSGDDPDPAQLQSALNEKDAELRNQNIELAAMKAAPKNQADPTALLDSRTFLEKAAKLDPDADNFASELDSLIKKTVDDNPKLKAGQAPPKGGADLSGGTGDTPARTLEDAVSARLGG